MTHPLTRAGHLQRLAGSKPTQADMDTAARVLRWLADHAHFFPAEYGEGDSYHLARAADACGVDPAALVLTARMKVKEQTHE